MNCLTQAAWKFLNYLKNKDLTFLFDINELFNYIIFMGISELTKNYRKQILALAEKYGASEVRVFGSVARGTEDEKSDIDFLVDLAPGRSLLDLGGLLYELQQLLGRDVDVVTSAGLRPRIREQILREARYI